MKLILTKQAQPVPHDFLQSLANMKAEQLSSFESHVNRIKEGRYSYAGFITVDGCQSTVFLKCYKPKGIFQRCLFSWGVARAYRAYHVSCGSILPVVSSYALVRNTYSSNLYVFYNAISGSNLSEYYKSTPETQNLSALLADCGHKLAALHEAGWTHGDFKWGNVLVNRSQSSVIFADMDAARSMSRYNRSACGRDIARFIVNAEDYHVDENLMSHFLSAYANTVGLTERACIKHAQPALEKLRLRHDRKYGLRQQRLFDSENYK